MRTFGPNDPLEPVLLPSSNPEDTPPARLKAGVYVILLGLVFVGVAFLGPEGPYRWVMVAVGGIAAVLGAFQVLSSRAGYAINLSPTAMWPLVAIVCGAIALAEWSDSKFTSFAMGAFAVVALLATVNGVVRARREREIAREMREAGAAGAGSTAVEMEPSAPAEMARNAPPMRLEVYLQRELPFLVSYAKEVTAESNIVGRRPQRILYLYNFFAEKVDDARWGGAWRRFGPVYYLGSPKAVSGEQRWGGNVEDEVLRQLLTTCEAVDKYLASAAEGPMPAADPELTGYAFYAGGYPQHMLLCTDANWQHAVNALFALADVVLIDASNYRPARAGLNWEIAHVVDHVPTSRFVVLLDGATDQVAIGEQFRHAWANMRAASPNNRPDASPVRFVLVEAPKRREIGQQSTDSAFPEEFSEAYGDLEAMKRDHAFQQAKAWKANLTRTYLAEKYRNIPGSDRIFGLLMDAGAVRS
jgi:hypothetical protein